MKFLIVAALLAVAYASPVDQHHVSVTEDTLGFYKFHFDTPEQSRYEERDHDGSTKGRFFFIDNDGGKHELKYSANVDHGFVADSADIPVAPPLDAENPEVVKARNAHLAVWNERAASEGVFEEKLLSSGLRHTGPKTVKVLVPVIEYVRP